MANTHVLISSVVVGAGGTSSIDFTNISQTYTDLLILHSLRSGYNAFADDIGFRFNNDTGNNYSLLTLYGQNANSGSGTVANNSYGYLGYLPASTATANVFSNGYLYIPNYTANIYKSSTCDNIQEYASSSNYTLMMIGNIWNSNSAITSIKLFSSNGANWLQYSSAELYGIKNS